MLEVEAKFAIPTNKVFRALLQCDQLQEFRLRSPHKEIVTDVYYDSPEGLLASSGYGCRVRRVGGKSFLTLKYPGQVETRIHKRKETELALPKGSFDPSAWPVSSITKSLQSLVEVAGLVEVCHVRQTRHKRLVGLGRRVPLEWSLDRVVARSQEKETQFLELEIELRPSGKPEDLRRFLEAFDSSGLVPLETNKLERILSEVGPSRKTKTPSSKKKSSPASRLEEPIIKAATRVFKRHYRQVLRREKGTLKGKDIEELHQMRTSVRRLRAALDLFLPYLQKKAEVQAEKAAKELAKALGRVRDLDVILKEFDDYREGHLEEFASFDPLHLIRERIEKKRGRERKKMVAFLRGRGYRQFKKDFEKLFEASLRDSQRQSKRTPPSRVRDVFPVFLWDAYGRILRFDPEMNDASPATLHELRIECKRMRYLLESFAKPFEGATRELRDLFKRAQEDLGVIQDAEVTHDLLEGFLSDLSGLGLSEAEETQTRKAILLYQERNAERQESYRRKVPSLWAEIVGDNCRKQLNRLVEASLKTGSIPPS